MGMLVAGEWQEADLPPPEQAQHSPADNGQFVRPQSTFREQIGVGTPFAPESQRYHLFANAGCPWAYRVLLYRRLKNLTPHIALTLTEPAAGPQGWTFGAQPEALLGATHLHQVYTAANPDFTGRCTVPVLWDTKLNTIVNNESADLIRQLNSAFNALPAVDPVDYYPAALRAEIDEWNERIYAAVNNGVYRCGFARSQVAYDEAYAELFETLDALDSHLAGSRFLCGDTITEADWRLFSTLVRFDLAYYSVFRCNRQMLRDFAALWPYTRDLYQQPGVAETVDFAAIKGIYYGSRAPGILPAGPDIDFSQAADREL